MIPPTTIPEVLLTLAIAIAIAPFLGSYIARVYRGGHSRLDPVFLPVERTIYRLFGIDANASMTWKQYFVALVLTDGAGLLIVYALLTHQAMLPGNALGSTNMSWHLAFHTASAFVTNTDYQHYDEEAQSQFVALFGLQFLMYLSPTTGLCVFAAIARGFSRTDGTVGNYYTDTVRTLTRILIPLTFIGAFLLVISGVPQTLAQSATIFPLSGGTQQIPLGPYATWDAIEFLGTNGGGYLGANAAHPFQNPNAISNFIAIILMTLIPFATPFAFGRLVRRKGESLSLFAAAFIVFIIGFAAFLYFEGSNGFLPSQVTQNAGYFVGADSRFTIAEQSLFQFTSIYTNTGATTMSLAALPAPNQAVALFGMFLQSAPGGVGTGFGMLIIYVVVAVFMGGLMVGRSPEYLGKKVSMPQVKWAAAALLSHPIGILIPVAISLQLGDAQTALGGLNPHSFTILLYEFTSESANNGSGMAPIADYTLFFNVAGALVMLLGRYFPIFAMLAIAGTMSEQKVQAPGPGTLQTDSFTFTLFLVLFLVVVAGLLFLPVLALGPFSQLVGGL